jgi:transposase InsO family protein
MPSMGTVGRAYDNAMAESFFASLDCEVLDCRRFKSQIEVKMAIFERIEACYNPHRRLLTRRDSRHDQECATVIAQDLPACQGQGSSKI